jgi:nucleotide-binding universal stress UspA family protein
MAGLTVIGYDGSADAQHAVDVAASVLAADAAVVVSVWIPGVPPQQIGAPLVATPPLPTARDEELERSAGETAAAGVARARQAGLNAEPLSEQAGSTSDIGQVLTTVAERRGADTIVVGRRGMSRLEALVLGSVSDATVRQARCPVVVVPSED